MSAPLAACIEGVAWWSPRLPSWERARLALREESDAVLSNETSEVATRPSPAVLPPAERRRAPDTVAIALEVAVQACKHAKRAPGDVQTVFASTHGDLAITDYMCATLASEPGLLSPTKFHNSVHNAAAGYWSIATKSHASYSALSAFNATFAAGLLDALLQVSCDAQPVLYVAYDIEARGLIASVAPSESLLAVALLLSPLRRSAGARIEVQLAGSVSITPAASAAARAMGGNALAPALPFFEVLAKETSQRIALALSAESTLLVDLAPGEAM